MKIVRCCRSFFFWLFLPLAVSFLNGCALTNSVRISDPENDSEIPFQVDTKITPVTLDTLDTLSMDGISIDQMIDQANRFSADAQYAEADSLLRQVIRFLGYQYSESDWVPADEYMNEVIRIYTEVMPSEMILPDEIAALVFKRQMMQSLDSTVFSASDSTMMLRVMSRKDFYYDVPIIWNERVQKALTFYLKNRRETINRWLSRAAIYLPFMRQAFADSGLPQDLAYLPLIESGFNPKAYSRAHASGIWQFIASTGSIYGLRNNYWVDERRDPIKSTNSAIRYLKKLYGDFNNWHLALAAYNCGEGGLGRAIKRCETDDYWQLTLPKETMNYVPLYLAALTIAKNPEFFGFSVADSDTFSYDTVSIGECIDLKDIAEGIGTDVDTLRRINPHILHWCTPPDMTNITLYLPPGSADSFREFLSNLPDEKKVRWYRYKIKQGDNLSTIARQFKLPLEPIKAVNRLKDNRIVAGKYLFIPIPVAASTVTEQPVDKVVKREKNHHEEKRNGEKIRYRVKKGDTVWGISELFNVSPGQICEWNSIQDSQIREDQILVIYTQGEQKSKPVKQYAQNNVQKYHVQPGDTPASITRMFNMSIDELVSLNNLDIKNPVIYAGHELTVLSVPNTHSSFRPPQSKPVTYVVAEGDNLFRISQNFSIPLQSLLVINNLTEKSVIHIGDVLLIPPADFQRSEKPEDQQIVFYQVKAGDNLWQIANSFGVPVQRLFESNNLSSNSVLMPGDTIRVIK